MYPNAVVFTFAIAFIQCLHCQKFAQYNVGSSGIIFNDQPIFVHTVSKRMKFEYFLENHLLKMCFVSKCKAVSSWRTQYYQTISKWSMEIGAVLAWSWTVNKRNLNQYNFHTKYSDLYALLYLITDWKATAIWVGTISTATICKSHWKWWIFIG